MGRVKLKIKKLEHNSNRQITYSKRRSGILKKAKELSILCDIDLILLMFSPTGRPTLCVGENSTIDAVIARYSQLTPQERTKRKLESLEALKKTFKKLDHEVNIQDFIRPGTQAIEELSNQSQLLQAQLSEIHRRLSYWVDPDRINNIDEIIAMEEALKVSLSRIQAHKESFGKQLMPIDCAGQFQNGMHLPLGIGCEHEAQPSSWPHNHDCENIMLTQGQSLMLALRDMCPDGSSLPSYSGYFSADKIEERTQSTHDESSGNACLRLQVAGQYPYPYGHNLLSETKFKTQIEMDLQGPPHLDYQVNRFEPNRLGYNADPQNWASTSGSCTVPLFDENPFPQQQTE